MNIKIHILKIFKYYSREYIISGIAFILTYLSIFLIFSFSSIVEQKALASFNFSFKKADFIFSSKEGIAFDKTGSLIIKNVIDKMEENKIVGFLQAEGIPYKTIISSNTENSAFILVFLRSNISRLFTFCNDNNILVKSSLNKEKSLTSKGIIMYDVNGYKNRFNVFSFQDQITSFIIGNEFSSTIGQLSRLVFIFSLIFTFYLSLLYFKEKQVIYRVLLLQGFTDLSLQLIFIEFLLINLSALMVSVIPLVLILWLNGMKISYAFWGVLYALPYLPVILLIQVLILFNRVLNSLEDE